jgi:hypothetical protein
MRPIRDLAALVLALLLVGVTSGLVDKDRINGGAGEGTCYAGHLDVIKNCEHIVR